MSDPNLWVGVWREHDPQTRKHYPIEPKPEWLWRAEWERMIWGDRETMLAAIRAAIKSAQTKNKPQLAIKRTGAR